MDFWFGFSIFLFLCASLQWFVSPRYQHFISMFMMVFLTFLSAFRYEIGVDYSGYQKFFDILSLDNENYVYPEISFQLLITILRQCGFDFQMMFLIYSIGISVFMWKGFCFYFKDQRKVSICIAIWGVAVFYVGWWVSVNVIRQYLAAAIFFYSSKYIITKNFYKFALSCILALLIHYSAGILLFCYLINYIDIKKKWWICFAIIAGIISVIDIIPTMMNFILDNVGLYSAYIDYVTSNGKETMGLSVFFIILQWVIFLLLHDKKNVMEGYVFKMCSVAMFIRILFDVPFTRMGIFFAVFNMPMIVYCIEKFRGNVRILIFFIIMCIYIFNFLKVISDAPLGYEMDWRKSASNNQYELNFKLIK